MRLLRRLMLLCGALTAISCGGPDEPRPVDELTGEVLLDLAGTHDMHRLMEDADLTGGGWITTTQVQQFLQQKGSYLAGYRDPAWGSKTAATLIVERSRAHGISPLYMLARIQIESSLIQSGTSTNLAKATGCGCPDSGGCNTSYAGFGNQVECGAAKIRGYLRDLDAGRPTVSGWKVGLTKQTSDPCTVTPANKATAALYTYTPWVGAYAMQCGRSTVGGSSLMAAVFTRYRSDYNWGSGCVLQGDIKVKYDAVNGPVLLGACRAGELATPDGVGRFNHFERGSIYWTQALGAHVVLGSIHDRWEALNWEKGVLGYPITDELTTPDGVGRYNHFERGSIYWTQATGAWEVHGLIREKWKALGWETSPLGYPITGEMKTPDGVGRYNHFRKGTIEGSIYWTQVTGAWAVYGAIREKWKSLGWENSALGYPVSDEYAVTGGRESEFQKGFITYDSTTGALTVRMK
ncbi:LGFP repeat-containing protein [Archangium gephyra]|uniref:LGFP repeat-containing protein n=1 Tax=Archangium gephyra TaxID=48 RepID=UPI003B826E23